MTQQFIHIDPHLSVFFAFCIITGIQIFYHLFFFIRLAFHTHKTDAASRTHPVSVVVCARDEAANLALYLPGILMQEYRTTHEVIVVNDNSFDDSKYVLEELRKKYRQLQVIELTQEAKMIPGKKFPLAIGIKSAKNEILLLTDADCVPATEHWIDSMQSCYKDNTEIVLGYSPYQKKEGFLNKLIRWETYLTALQYLSYALAGLPYMGVGRNLSYKKEVFFRHKGFASHNQIPGGDDDLFVNAAATGKNTAINISKDSFTISRPANTWKQWMRQKKRHYATGKYYKPTHQFLLGIFSLSQFLFYPAFILSCLFFSWKYSVAVWGCRFLIQGVVHVRSMIQLDEKDLIPFFPLFDIWMFFHYLIFVPSVFRKPARTWN